ncbi:MAG: cytochrome c maturation protein CcmE [Gammaproteobacteria bacterium]|jgi:cytochrome c-type biogenesis protein CcmE
MNPKRRQRLLAVAFLLVGAGAAVGVTLVALDQNINLFYAPDQIVGGEAPTGARIRAGGMVLDGSLERGEGLVVRFVIGDLKGAEVPVTYEGILPDLFREGQGIVATGVLHDDGVFEAQEVLAKHDENYMPPELADMGLEAEGSAR